MVEISALNTDYLKELRGIVKSLQTGAGIILTILLFIISQDWYKYCLTTLFAFKHIIISSNTFAI